MLNRVLEFIDEHNLVQDGDRIVVGVSGGADSVCLLHALHELYKTKPVELIVVHINHGLRGQAANEDEEFVRALAKRLGVGYYGVQYDVGALAIEEAVSEEEAGRIIRYRTFLQFCSTHKCNKIAIAHNKNDNAETVLFNLFRGSGIRGLAGINPSRQLKTAEGKVRLIRPLLFAMRGEIEAYLEENQISYQTDASNFTELYSRNKIRNRVLSYVVQEINTCAVEHITEAAEELAETEAFINNLINEKYEELVMRHSQAPPFYEIKLEEIKKHAPLIQRGLLLRVLEELGGSRKNIGRKHIQLLLELCDKQVGKQLELPYGVIAKRGYDILQFFIAEQQPSQTKEVSEQSISKMLKIPGKTVYRKLIVESGVILMEKGLTFPKNSCTKWFDYDKIENAVELRSRKTGDYIQIDDLGRRKKLKDYFIDIKLPKEKRNDIPLIADGNHIMWIVGAGNRMSEKYKIDENTHRILWISLFDTEEKQDGR